MITRQKVDSFGPSDARIMVVGEAPSADEERVGKPFIGKAGQLLRDFLMRSGINPTEVRYANICKYRPPGNNISAWIDGGAPNELIVEGLTELQSEILAVAPNVILLCGSHPLALLTGKGQWNPKYSAYTGIQDWRGSILDAANLVPGQKCVATFHPSYILQEGYKDHGFFLCDLARLKEQSASPDLDLESSRKEIVLDPRGPDRAEWRDRLLRAPIIAFDIEYIDSKLLCCGMTDSADSAVVFGCQQSGDVDFIREILMSGVPLCAQNAMFDCSILEYWYGIHCMQYLRYDTMIAAHAANIELAKDLGTLASIYTDQPNWKHMIDWRAVRAGDQPMEVVYRYNAIDVWTTYAIMEAQLREEFGVTNAKEYFNART